MLFKKLAAVLLAGGIVLSSIGQVFADERIDTVLELAKQQVEEHDVYEWGAVSVGENPSSFDCSSYIQWLFGRVGIELPRTSNLQAREGIEVSPDDIRAGDVVTFVTSNRRGGDVTHIAIFLDNGQTIAHARSTKYGVCINEYDEYWKSKTYNIRRYIEEPTEQEHCWKEGTR